MPSVDDNQDMPFIIFLGLLVQSCCKSYSRSMQVIFGAQHVIQYKAALALSDSQDYMHVLCAISWGLFAHGDNNKF